MYGGVPFRSTGDPPLYLSNPEGFDEQTQRASLDTLNALNASAFERQGDPDIAARIQSYEMAYRLQSSAPELIDLVQRAAARAGHVWHQGCEGAWLCTQLPLGPSADRTRGAFRCSFSTRPGISTTTSRRACRTMRRKRMCQAQRGAGEGFETAGTARRYLGRVGGEFGRAPMVQGGNDGRDHHNRLLSRSGWQAVAWSKAMCMARPMIWASTWRLILCT